MQLSPYSSQPKKPPVAPRFGAAGHVAPLKGLTGMADQIFKRVTHDRTTEMLLEDFVGFGLLRTWMDLRRGQTYGDNQSNWPAASERMARETLSILTDNVLAGGVAYAMAKAMDKGYKGLSNQFIDFDTLNLFKEIAGRIDGKRSAVQTQAETAFLDDLTGRLKASNPQQCRELLEKAWKAGKAPPEQTTFKQGFQNWMKGKKEVGTLKDAANLANAIRNEAQSFQWETRLGNGKAITLKLDGLLDDLARFSRHMDGTWAAKAKMGAKPCWKDLAQSTIKHTLQTKSRRIPVAILAAMGATFAVPFAITEVTRKVWGINYYPGELGLKNKETLQNRSGQPEGFFERHFPYIAETLKNGNPLPFLLTLLPVPFAVGCFDTVKQQFKAPWKLGRQAWLKMFDFQKGKPFTAQQQMASVFALLITSRLLNARTDNEFRERMVDSFLGWGIWILGTPKIKEMVARISDKKFGTKLLKQVGNKTVLRTREEIEHLLKDGIRLAEDKGVQLSQEVLDKTYRANVRIGIGSTIATMLMLGIVEPWVGIKLTQWNEKRKQAKQPPVTAQPTAFASPAFKAAVNNTVLPSGSASLPGAVYPAPMAAANPGISPFSSFGALPGAPLRQQPYVANRQA